jgi:DNA-binding SARP family transcriptional activator/Tfp pilus assembly protein PilF
MAPNVAVPADVLIDRLWGDDPPPKARATIRSYIWRIDRALALTPGAGVQVSRQAHGYALEIDPHAVDLHRFRSLKRQSDALAESGETRHAAMRLREAEAIWRGGALAGLPGDWIARVRNSIEEERRTATARRIELELALGRHAELLAELGELTERHPLDEGLAGQRMVALFRSGRQADALRTYRETRARLVAVGVEPGPELARLHQRVLQHDPELAITPVYRRAGREPQPNTLPPDIDDFVGRAEEMLLLTEETGPDDGPTLRIVEGMGGVGKTTLVIHAGHRISLRYPDAQLYLNLGAHDRLREPVDPGNALRDLLKMLHVPAERIPGTLDDRAKLWRAELACRRAMIILDDVTGPEQVRPLLPDAGDCLIIATSRRRHQDWGAAREVTLRVLAEDDAAALFTRIADRAADREPDHIAVVSRLCGCLPLAIRLAASRLRSGAVVSLPDLLDELDEPAAGQGQASEISRRVQAAFELSYRRLTAGEQRFFRYLGISPCLDITANSAAVLAGVSLTEAQAALCALSNYNLLEETCPGTFGFHDLIRAFAATRFASEEPEPEIRHAVGHLADYYIRSAQRASHLIRAHRRDASGAGNDGPLPMPFTGTPEAARVWLESEWGNALRVGEHCARHEWKRRCADLVHALAEFLETSGYWDDALAAQLMALQASRDLDDLRRTARAAFDLSLTSLRTGHGAAALQHATEAVVAFGSLGDKRGQAAALDRIGIIHRNAARFRDALAYHQEALDINREAGDQGGVAKALRNAGIALGALGRYTEEMTYLSQALDIYRESSDLRGQAITLNNIGAVQYYQGYHRDAMRSYQASLDIFRKIGGKQTLALVDHNIGRMHQYKGDYRAAIIIYRHVLATYRSIGDLQHQAYALADIGSIYRCTERFDEALAHYEKAASVAEKSADRYEYAEALCGIAEAHYGSGRLNAALEKYEQVAKLAGEIESLYLRAKALNGKAEIALRTHGVDAARIYWREAHDIFAQLGVAEAATVEIRLHTLDASAS